VFGDSVKSAIRGAKTAINSPAGAPDHSGAVAHGKETFI
jgi:hypothetical protein